MTNDENYEPFGDEWKKEISKLTKSQLIEMYRDLAMKNVAPRTAANPLTVESVVEAVRKYTTMDIDSDGSYRVIKTENIENLANDITKLATSKTPTVVINNNPINPFFI